MSVTNYRHLMLIASVCLAVLAHVFAPAPAAHAQAASTLAVLTIDVWPEYDRASTVLVIYRGEFAPDAAVPAQVKLRIPAAAGVPSAVASPKPGEETTPVNQWSDLIATKRVTTTVSGDWTLVTLAPLSRVFTLEFYDKVNTVTFDRSYALTWPGDLAADAVTLNMREPYGATDFQTTPALPAGQRDDEGLIPHQAPIGALAPGQALALTVSYHREDKRTSVEALQIATPEPTRQPVTVPAVESSATLWPFIAALVVGLALIVGGVIWYLRSRQPSQAYRPYQPPRYAQASGRKSVRTSRAPRSRPRPVAVRLEDETDEKIFCTQCGRQLNADDAFCPRCGTRVKGK
jgi:hypothetical protein